MPVVQQPTGPIEVSDPNNVPEIFVSGPFNIMNAGGMVHITSQQHGRTRMTFSGAAPPLSFRLRWLAAY